MPERAQDGLEVRYDDVRMVEGVKTAPRSSQDGLNSAPGGSQDGSGVFDDDSRMLKGC